MQRAGVTQVTLPAAEIFTSLQTGAIDAAEWVGPYNDVSLGLHKAARYYYYPGWQEPGPTIELVVNREAWNTLPEDLQAIIEITCQSVTLDMQSEYNYGNAMALQQLENDPNVEIRPFPDDVMALLRKLSMEAVEELSAEDEWSARIQKSFFGFMEASVENQRVSEQAFLNARSIAVE
jgi:TRAP-type mannitol/chloroaromatic compound transport system substrate-binding protein